MEHFYSIRMVDSEFQNIYYQPQNLWKYGKAIAKLKKLTGADPERWLSKQAFWQIHLPPPHRIQRPHYEVIHPNQLHQFDLLYMPSDKLYGNRYKYILTGIDVASRFKVARPLKTKKSKEVAEMISDIYKTGPLKYPEEFQCDNGTEFKSDVTTLLEKHNVKINRTTTKYKHTHTAFVENLNKMLAQNLFKIQDAQELNDSEMVSSTWVKHLYELINDLNDTETQLIGMKPKDAVKLKDVTIIRQKRYPLEEKLSENGLYRYLLLPGEEHEDRIKRATDNVWSRKTFRLSKIVQQPNNRIMYYLLDGPNRSFVKEELMRIPEDTEPPPDYVQKW